MCEFCNGDKNLLEKQDKYCGIAARVEGNKLYVSALSSFWLNCDGVEIKYCPICGEELKKN